MVDAIYSGMLSDAPTQIDSLFGLHVVTACADVPEEILVPRDTWQDTDAYDRTARKLAAMFGENFSKYAEGVSADDVVTRLLETVPEPSYGEGLKAPSLQMVDRAPQQLSPTEQPAAARDEPGFLDSACDARRNAAP